MKQNLPPSLLLHGQTQRKWRLLWQPLEERPRPLGWVEGAGPLLPSAQAASSLRIPSEEPVLASYGPTRTATLTMSHVL